MIIASYNVNGIRSALKKGFLKWASESKAEIVCLQEVRISLDQIDLSIFEEEGWRVALFPSARRGYSGTGILSRYPLTSVERGSGDALSDEEGRVISSVAEGIKVTSAYTPSGSSGPARQNLKMQWLSHFDKYTKSSLEKNPSCSIIAGDFNICHKEIDIHNPKGLSSTSGFLPEEREWVDSWMSRHQLVDTFREQNPEKKAYSWWSQRGRAKEKNLGWRIDYLFVTKDLSPRVKKSWIDSTAPCSDHCPTLIELE